MELTADQQNVVKRIVKRQVVNPQDREDVLQEAYLIALRRDLVSDLRFLVFDAIRAVYGQQRGTTVWRTVDLERPEWLASTYATDAHLREREIDEESEDQAEEWLNLPAAERSQRQRQAAQFLGTSPEGS